MNSIESIEQIISKLQSDTRDAIALLRMVADEYEKAHNNVQELVEVYLPGSVKTASTSVLDKVKAMHAMPHYPLDSAEMEYLEKDPNVPVKDNAGNFEIVPGTAGKATALNMAAETRKVLDQYYKKDAEFTLGELYKEVRKTIPDASTNAMYNAYYNHVKNSGWEAVRVMKHDKVYFHLVEKH